MSEVELLESVSQVEESVAEPAEAESACERLVHALASYEQAGTELEDLRGHFSRAEADEVKALDDPDLSEAQALKGISQAQDRKSVYISRIGHKEREVAKLGAELETTYHSAAGELRGLVSKEISVRGFALQARLLELLEIEKDAQIQFEISNILLHSQQIRRVSVLNPNGYIEPGNFQQIATMAHLVLENLKAFESEATKGL